MVRESVDEDNQIKQIASKNGSHIKFVDNKEGEGEKDQIELQTAGKKHTVLLDNENKKILISDEKKKNYIVNIIPFFELKIMKIKYKLIIMR